MDIPLLLSALENEKNEYLLDMTFDKIFEQKIKILMDISLTKKEIDILLTKLHEYYYVDDILKLKGGHFLRWIYLGGDLLESESFTLNKGGYFCSFNVKENYTYIQCKTHFGKYFQIKMDECLVFQKLTNSEKILLNSMHQLITHTA